MEHVILRPYNRSDASRVVEVVNADAAKTTGLRRAVVDGVGNIRLASDVPSHSEQVVAVTASDDVVGYAYLADRERGIVTEVGGAVHPDFWGQGIGTALVAWAEERARVLARHIPPGIRTVLQAGASEAETRAAKLLTTSEFARTREAAHFVIEMDTPPRLTAVNDIVIRPFDLEHDWELVEPAMEQAFLDHWGTIDAALFTKEELAAFAEVIAAEADASDEVAAPEDSSYSNSPGFCFIALAGDVAVGGILCNAKLVERDDTGRVGSMFVHPQFRRQGIGRALMLTAFDAFWRHGMRRLILDTDADSFTQAPMFYASLGMQHYRREFLYEKELRPGREVRRLGA